MRWVIFLSKCGESKPVLCCLLWQGCRPVRNDVFLFRVSLLSALAWWAEMGEHHGYVVNNISGMLQMRVAFSLWDWDVSESLPTCLQFARPAGLQSMYKLPRSPAYNIQASGWSLTHGLPLTALWWFRERRDDDEEPSLPGQPWLPRWQISIISIILHTSDYCFLAVILMSD